MKPKLIAGLDELEQEHVEAEYASSGTYRANLSKVLEEEIQTSLTKMRNGVGSTNLTEFYAEQLGYQKALLWALTYLK